MLRRLHFDRTHTYQIAVTTEMLAGTLVDYLNNDCQLKQIGREKGDLEEWDDCIQEDWDGNFLHYQVKNQTTNFSDDDCIRGVKTSGPNIGKPSDLSVLDKAIIAVFEWYKNCTPTTDRTKKKFVLWVPEPSINIKSELPIRDLEEFCRIHMRPATTVAGLNELLNETKRFANLIKWLDSWCNIKSLEDVVGIFTTFKVEYGGSTEKIHQRTDDKLRQFFRDPSVVRAQIDQVLSSNATITTEINADYLYSLVKPCLQPEKLRPWTKYYGDALKWSVSGIIDGIWPYVERPEAVIAGIWNESVTSTLFLKAPLTSINTKLFKSISRMCLHLPGASNAHVSCGTGVAALIKQQVGGTIGKDMHEPLADKVYDKNDIRSSSVGRNLEELREQEAEADALAEQMSNFTWEKICGSIPPLLAGTAASMKAEIEARWYKVRNLLDENTARRDKLFRLMMQPAAEKPTVAGDLRVGPATVSLLAEALYHQLIVLEALGADDNELETVRLLSIQAIALITWSGPSHSATGAVRKLGDIGSVELLGQEPSHITILSQVSETPIELMHSTMADSSSLRLNIAARHQPLVVLTQERTFRQLIRAGNLPAIKTHIEQSIDKTKQSAVNVA